MKSMNAGRLIVLFLALGAALLTGCSRSKSEPPAPTTVIKGIASEGLINKGVVKVFAIRSGVTDTSAPIGHGRTDRDGDFTVNIGAYEGPVMVEVSGGSFLDPVSGAQVTQKSPLRAMVSNVTIAGPNTAAVTPLTELAVVKAERGGALTGQAIDDANAAIASFFNLNDIISTVPDAEGTGDEKKYDAFLGSFSQFVNNNENPGESLDDAMPRLIAQMSDDLGNEGGISIVTITGINTGISDFAASGKNGTGVSVTPLPVPTTASLKLKLSSTETSSAFGAVDVTVDLPDGITVVADAASGETAAGIVTITGDAGKGDSSIAKFTPASATAPAHLHITLLNTNGFGLGDFATIKVDRDPSGSFPVKEAFSIASVTVEGLDGPFVGGITASSSFVGVEIK